MDCYAKELFEKWKTWQKFVKDSSEKLSADINDARVIIGKILNEYNITNSNKYGCQIFPVTVEEAFQFGFNPLNIEKRVERNDGPNFRNLFDPTRYGAHFPQLNSDNRLYPKVPWTLFYLTSKEHPDARLVISTRDNDIRIEQFETDKFYLRRLYDKSTPLDSKICSYGHYMVGNQYDYYKFGYKKDDYSSFKEVRFSLPTRTYHDNKWINLSEAIVPYNKSLRLEAGDKNGLNYIYNEKFLAENRAFNNDHCIEFTPTSITHKCESPDGKSNQTLECNIDTGKGNLKSAYFIEKTRQDNNTDSEERTYKLIYNDNGLPISLIKTYKAVIDFPQG